MCGICGILYSDPRKVVNPRLVRRMCDEITHRGPDDEGYYISDFVGLGMRRLSIIDLISGDQPIHNEDGTVHVVFNGEIYNYRELRATLEACGHSFYTQSDTEVIVHAYEEYGELFVEYLRGMYGFALWDASNRILLLVIDRFGIKPLYYTVNGQAIAFGSELKCLLVSGMLRRNIDFDALAQYFALGYIPAPTTIFQEARKLSPGYLLRWTPEGGADIRQYWDLPIGRIRYQYSPAKTRQQLREALRQSVHSHLVSDVPLGAFLSGGIDSSTVVALMSEASSEPVKTFSIGFADDAHNELDMARLVANHFDTDHHEFLVEPENVDVLPKLVTHFDEPFADPSALPTYYVSKVAREFVKVALSGDGGDELFLGYTIFRGLELARYMQFLPEPLRRIVGAVSALLPRVGKPEWDDRVARWGKRLADSMLTPAEAYRSKITVVEMSNLWSCLSDEFQHHLQDYNPYRMVDEYLARYSVQDGMHALEPFVYNRLKVALAGDMLVKVDRMSMANSLEVRVPLLDHMLAEYVATIPIEQRFPRWRLKGLLRDTMVDVLPPDILRQPKHGFTVPITAWFRGDLSGFAADVLLDPESQQRGFLNVPRIESLLRKHRYGARNLGRTIWSLLIFELWSRQVLDSV